MTVKELICVICPNGCQLRAEIEEGPVPRVIEVTGHLCDKGPAWAEQEIVNPIRTIASSIRVHDGDQPLVSVKTDRPIPLGRIMDVMRDIKAATADAPVRIGDILIPHPAGTECNIMATRHVKPMEAHGPAT
jgi:CxxC motif-containing protein